MRRLRARAKSRRKRRPAFDAPDAAGPLEPVRDQMLVFGAPQIGEAEIEEVVATLRSGWIGTGPRVARFESDFASYQGVDSAVAVSSCTAALQLCLRAAGIGPGDEVVTTALTFCATANAILHVGATPVLADVDPETMNMTAQSVAERLTEKTRAIVPVHFAGRPCPMDDLMALAERKELVVIEDCAHAIESRDRGRPMGTLGDFGAFSFYVTKNVSTAEGGMVLARDAESLARIKTLALHGLSKDAWKRFSDDGYRHYTVQDAGFKFNMTDLQAALGIHQLARIESNWERRRLCWGRYDDSLQKLPLTLPAPTPPELRHALHLYTVLVDDRRTGISRDEFLNAMTGENIGVGVHYLSLAEHPYYQELLGWRPEDTPNAMRIGRQTVSLPLSAALSERDVDDVLLAVHKLLG
jgi:dTDP-4-amino-4,6-dideoxygalactose transaminase